MRSAAAMLLAAALGGCYGTVRTSFPEDDAGAGRGGSGGGGSGGVRGIGGQSGTSGGSGTGTGTAGGAGGTAGTATVFAGGPCIVTADALSLQVFGRGSDGHVYRRAYDGTNWNGWSKLSAVDGTLIDARSDLDCSPSATSVHLVATGLNPVGAILHAFGSGTVYNPFRRELSNYTFEPSATIADWDDNRYTLGGLAVGAAFPAVYELGETPEPDQLTPITSETNSLLSAPDIVVQPSGASKLTYFVAFDTTGSLAIYRHIRSSGGAVWDAPVTLPPPVGTFAFSPTVCVENGAFGVTSVNVSAVAGGRLWYSRKESTATAFSSWTMIGTDTTSSPDCAVIGADSTVHVVTVSSRGTVVDANGKDTTWVTTDLGPPG